MSRRNAAGLLTLLTCMLCLNAQMVPEDSACLCQNQGNCTKLDDGVLMCECPAPFLGRQCQQEGFPLSSERTNFTITGTPSLFYQDVNASYLNLVKLICCPLSDAPHTTLLIQLRMEDTDGSLEGMVLYEGEYRDPVKDRCFMVGFWMPSVPKYNGDPEKVVMRVHSTVSANATLEPLEVTAFSSVYQYPILDFHPGQFLGYLGILTFFTFFGSLICFKLLLYRRRNRLRFAEAQPAQDNNIDHFSEIMPAQTHLVPEDEKDCVICLLNMEGDQVRRTPCGHVFHRECIDKWGVVNLTCPSCRTSLSRHSSSPSTGHYQPFQDVEEVAQGEGHLAE